MNWNREDNKRYRGKIDRIFVSMTEQWETDYYIDAYLRRRGADLTDANRDVVFKVMERFPGKAPVLRTVLDTFLDKEITVK